MALGLHIRLATRCWFAGLHATPAGYKSRMYIGIGTVVLILVIVLIVMLLRRG